MNANKTAVLMTKNLTDSYNNDSNTTLTSPVVTGSPTMQPRKFPGADLILYWGVPIAAIIGFLFNCVTIALMRRPTVKKSVMGIYFTSLAAVDIVFLTNMFMMYSDKTMTGYNFLTAHGVSCKLINFLMLPGYAITSWIVAAVALERCFVVLLPLKAMTFSNKRNAVIAVLTVVIVVGLFSCHPFITMDLMVRGIMKRCTYISGYHWFHKYIRPFLIAASVSYVPFIILVSCNILFVAKMVVVKAKRKSLTSSGMNYNLSKFTFTALVVCLAFCLCSVPNMIIMVVSNQHNWFSDLTLAKQVARNMIPLMSVIRASINFFVYVCTSKTFREELAIMCCGRCKNEK